MLTAARERETQGGGQATPLEQSGSVGREDNEGWCWERASVGSCARKKWSVNDGEVRAEGLEPRNKTPMIFEQVPSQLPSSYLSAIVISKIILIFNFVFESLFPPSSVHVLIHVRFQIMSHLLRSILGETTTSTRKASPASTLKA